MPMVTVKCDSCNPICDLPTKTEATEKYFKDKEQLIEIAKGYANYFGIYNNKHIDIIKQYAKN